MHFSELGGARRDRTVDLLHAMQALSQLSYSPNNSGFKIQPVSLSAGRILCTTKNKVNNFCESFS